MECRAVTQRWPLVSPIEGRCTSSEGRSAHCGETPQCPRDRRRRQSQRRRAEVSPAVSDARRQRPTFRAYCFRLREGIRPTAAIMTLAAISASSRTTPGGIPMASRAISASSKAVAVAASMPRTRSTVVIARRRKGIFTDRLGNCRKSARPCQTSSEAPARHGYHAISHAPGPRTQWRIRPHCPISK